VTTGAQQLAEVEFVDICADDVQLVAPGASTEVVEVLTRASGSSRRRPGRSRAPLMLLLERELASSILSRFSLSEITSYFPEYPSELAHRLRCAVRLGTWGAAPAGARQQGYLRVLCYRAALVGEGKGIGVASRPCLTERTSARQV
jgi:hypothetical protein